MPALLRKKLQKLLFKWIELLGMLLKLRIWIKWNYLPQELLCRFMQSMRWKKLYVLCRMQTWYSSLALARIMYNKMQRVKLFELHEQFYLQLVFLRIHFEEGWKIMRMQQIKLPSLYIQKQYDQLPFMPSRI